MLANTSDLYLSHDLFISSQQKSCVSYSYSVHSTPLSLVAMAMYTHTALYIIMKLAVSTLFNQLIVYHPLTHTHTPPSHPHTHPLTHTHTQATMFGIPVYPWLVWFIITAFSFTTLILFQTGLYNFTPYLWTVETELVLNNNYLLTVYNVKPRPLNCC